MPTTTTKPTDTSTHPWWARNTNRPYLQPNQVRHRTPRSALTTIATIAAITTGLWWILTATEVKDVTTEPNGILAYKQTTNALIGGCSPMYTHRDPTPTSGTVPATDTMGEPNRQTYETIVPMYGPFWDKPAPTDQTIWTRKDPRPPVPENLLANMWNGDMVIYYTAAATPESLTLLEEILTIHTDLDAIVVPWEEERGPLPQNRKFAFATWNNSQTCHELVGPAILDFRQAHPATEAPGHDGTKPPVLDDTPPINVATAN